MMKREDEEGVERLIPEKYVGTW